MIHKQVVNMSGGNIIVPYGSSFLKAGVQQGNIVLWYEFDPQETREAKVEVLILGTGWDKDTSGYTYIDSVFIDVFVWHIYLLSIS